MGKIIELVASDGHKLSAYRAEPSGKPRGAVVVIQEIFGVNSHIRSVADGYAADGYLAIAPAMYDRLERNFEVGYTPEDIARGRALKEKAGIAAALLDVEPAVKAAAQSGKVGIVGYCWGGYITWMAAARLPGLACAAPYYGGGSTTDEAIAEKPKCPVMAHYGEKDEHISVESVKKLAAAHPTQTVHLYPAPHGFNCDQRGSYDAESAKLARERTLAFFREHIG
jgi:carboxymethylenebutenolidase